MEEESTCLLDEIDDAPDNEHIEEVDNVQKCGGVVVGRVGFKDVESALVTLKKKLEHRPTDVTPTHRKHLSTSKGNRILPSTRISSNTIVFFILYA